MHTCTVPTASRSARIVTGGQTGVDRAATDVAVALGLPYGGFVPKGGWAEDLPDPPGLLGTYPGFTELDDAEVAVRTARNVEASAALLVISPPGATSGGTDLALHLARARGMPILVLDASDPAAPAQLRRFLGGLPAGCAINVAGPRESESPGIYELARALLGAAAAELARTAPA